MRRESVPADEYFDEFLSDFHRRQRQDLMKRSARSLLLERMGVWLREMEGLKWIYCAATAYVLVMVGLFCWPENKAGRELIEPASWESLETTVPHFEGEPSRNPEAELKKGKEF